MLLGMIQASLTKLRKQRNKKELSTSCFDSNFGQTGHTKTEMEIMSIPTFLYMFCWLNRRITYRLHRTMKHRYAQEVIEVDLWIDV